MTFELTKEGLFSYFDPETVKEIIELSLVKRHLSAHDYCQCRDGLSHPLQKFKSSHKNTLDPTHTILGFDALKHASLKEVRQYLGIKKINDAYVQCYGEYFSFFQAKILASTDNPNNPCNNPPPLLDFGSEKKLILNIQSAMSLPLQAFTNAILEQDFLLQEIASQLIYQARKAEQFISRIKDDDAKYKQTVVSLAVSLLKMGLGVFNVSELIDVSQSLSNLASGACETIEEKLSDLVSDIQTLVIHTHLWVLQEAESKLLSTTAPEEITLRWDMYRAHIFHSTNQSIKHVLDSCVNNDNFFRCIIKETIYQHQGLSQEMLLIHAVEKAHGYMANIANGLQSQVAKIRQIKNAVVSSEGSQNIEIYFRKIGLINYTLHHEKSGSMIQQWLTKPLGHLLTFYFPDVVFQKKWTPVRLYSLVHHGVWYSKQKITLQEYTKRRSESIVVLGLFRNSSTVKETLFATLEDKIPHLSDQLVQSLQQQNSTYPPAHENVFDDYASLRRGRRSFLQPREALFSFREPNPDAIFIKPLPKGDNSVVLIAQRELNP